MLTSITSEHSPTDEQRPRPGLINNGSFRQQLMNNGSFRPGLMNNGSFQTGLMKNALSTDTMDQAAF